MGRVKITSRNQITLPASVREKLNIKPGDYLQVEVRNNCILLTPEPVSYVERFRGFHAEIWEGVDAKEYVEHERSSWDK